jgi:predicted PurR-regulated permease PerM
MNGSAATKVLSRLWFVVVAVLAITVLYVAKVLFLPLAFAVLFAFLLAPVVSALERLRLPRALAAILVILGFAALVGSAGWMLFTQLVAVTNDLPIYRDNIAQKMEAIHSPSDSAFSRAQHEVQRLSEELGLANSSEVLHTPPARPGNKVQGATPDRPVPVREVARPTGRLDQLGGILEPLTMSFLCVVFTFFVLLQREDLRNRVIHISGDGNLSAMTQAMKDASARISRYFSLQLLVNLSYGTLVFLALYVIGLPHAVLFGSLAGLLRFVPYVGAPIAALLPTFLSLAVFHGWEHSVEIVATFTLLEVVTANYIEPRIYGKHTGLSSLAILVAAAFWTLIWGPVGLVLSVPLTVCLVVMGHHMPALEFLTVMLGDQPVVPPSACYYQRLLAHDQREAGDILETCLKDSSLENIYDSVLIPALNLSEQDRMNGDLDEASVEFIRRTTRDLIEDLGFRETTEAGPEPSAAPARETLPPVKVLCVPVRDETDELGALMLAQLLEAAGIPAECIPVRRLDEIVASISASNPDVVFLSGLPPFGVARAHRLYRTVRARFPHIRQFIGIWGYSDDIGKAAQKISRGESVPVSTTLANAVVQVRGFAGAGEPQAPEAPETSPANAA